MSRNRSFSKAVSRAVCETLETRRLLATYVVPSGNSSVYLDNGALPGQVVVRLNSPTANPVPGDPFSAPTGQHVLDAGTNGTSGTPFLVVDRVWARWKPQDFNANPEGVKVIASQGGNATLRIESNNVTDEFWDRQYVVVSSTSTNTRIDGYNYDTGEIGQTHIGAGVSNLVIRTNNVQATAHYSSSPPLPENPGTRVVAQNLVAGVHLTVDTGAGTYARVNLGVNAAGSGTGFLAEEATVITGAGNCIVKTRGINLDDQHTRARVDFGDGSASGNNFLHVDEFSTTTLAEAPGSADHVIVLEHAQVGATQLSKLATLLVEDESTILDLDNNAFGLSKVLASADGTEVSDYTVALDGQASIEGDSTIGLFTINGEVDFTSTSAPSTVTEFAATGSLSAATGVVNVNTGAIVTAKTTSRIATLNIPSTGTFTLQRRSDSPTVTTSRALTVKALSMGTTPTGKLDLRDNSLIVDYSGSSPLTAIQSLLTSGYNASGTKWQGNGIMSTLGDSTTYAVGIRAVHRPVRLVPGDIRRTGGRQHFAARQVHLLRRRQPRRDRRSRRLQHSRDELQCNRENLGRRQFRLRHQWQRRPRRLQPPGQQLQQHRPPLHRRRHRWVHLRGTPRPPSQRRRAAQTALKSAHS